MIIPKIITDFVQTWLFVRQPKTKGMPVVIGGKVYVIGYPTARRCREIERLIELPNFDKYTELMAQLHGIELSISETDNALQVEQYRKKLSELEKRIEAWSQKHTEFYDELRKITHSERAYDLWNALLANGLDASVPRETMLEYLNELPDTLLADMVSFFLGWRAQISINTRQKSSYMIAKGEK